MTATCPDCGARYDGRRQHCRGGEFGGCCRTFNSATAGDLHRVGDFASPGKPNTRRCMTAAEMVDSGMSDHSGVWYGPGWDADSHPRRTPQGGEQPPADGPATPQAVGP